MNTAITTPEWLNALMPVIVILGIWSAVWKAIALYKAGGNKNVAWFVVLFLVNTLGILEIFYIFVFSKGSKTPKK
jgi:methionyl-tRNA synthetase